MSWVRPKLFLPQRSFPVSWSSVCSAGWGVARECWPVLHAAEWRALSWDSRCRQCIAHLFELVVMQQFLNRIYRMFLAFSRNWMLFPWDEKFVLGSMLTRYILPIIFFFVEKFLHAQSKRHFIELHISCPSFFLARYVDSWRSYLEGLVTDQCAAKISVTLDKTETWGKVSRRDLCCSGTIGIEDEKRIRLRNYFLMG